MRVLGVPGALRSASYNRQLLRAAAKLLPPEAEFVEYDELKALPPFDEDDEPAPGDAVERWRRAIDEADALLFATPEYNSSIPGWLKNAVDIRARARRVSETTTCGHAVPTRRCTTATAAPSRNAVST